MRPHLLLAAAGLLSFTLAARADLTGNSIDAQYTYPTQTTLYQDLGTFTVPGGGNSFGETEYTITGDTITFTNIAGTDVTFTAAAFNGYKFVDLTGPTGITGITLVDSPTGGFSAADASFDPDDIYFNFQSNVLAAGETVTYDLEFAPSSVPEPATLPMLAGLFGLAGILRRRLAH